MTPARHSCAQIERCKTDLRRAVGPAFARHRSLESCDQRKAMLFDPAAYDHSTRAQVERSNLRARPRDTLPIDTQPQAQADHERRRKFIHLLTPPPHQNFELAKTAMGLQVAHAMATLGKPITNLLHKMPLVLGNVPLEFLARTHDQLRCGGRRGRAQVRDKIGNREIGFVPDTCDHRSFGSDNRARDYLLVERPQIFERASATRNDEYVGKFRASEIIYSGSDFFRGTVALHFHWIEPHMRIGKTALENAKNVADGSACGRRDDADASRQNRQRLLPGFVEKAFFLQALLQLFERKLQRAEANRFDIRDVNLIFAANIVDAD